MIMSACVTLSSLVVIPSFVVAMVTTFRVTFIVVMIGLVTLTSTATAAGSDNGLADRDEGVCWTRFLSSANGSADFGGDEVVGVAALLELRRPQGQGCGAVSAMELQTVAALMWAVNRLNGHTPNTELGTYIPGLRLELRVYDDCSQDMLAARHMGQLLSSHPDFNCTPATPPLAGILGTTTSHTTSFVARLLATTQIPHFGTSATVSTLSDKVTFPTFFRTVPSDLTQSKVLLDLVQQLKWTYVVGIYTSDNYGTKGFQEFKRLATQAGVCVFKEKAFWHSDQNVEDSMERFIRELLIELGDTRFSSLGVIFFGHDTEATILFQMIQDRRSRWHNREKVNQLYWLVSDGVGTSHTIPSLVEPYTLLSISPATAHLDDINEFFFHALDNPEELGPYWQTLVTEYLQEVLGCFEQQSPVARCRLKDKIEMFDYLPAALDSFYSLAALLGRAHSKACGGGSTPGLCQELLAVLKNGLLSLVQPQAMNYSHYFSPEQLPSYFRQDRFLVPDRFGDFMPANSPLYFINIASRGQWIKIGEHSNGSLVFNLTSHLTSIPRSECGTDCEQCKRSDAIRFTYQPGDILLLGLYSISSPSDSSSFVCGDYRRQSSSVAALLAFLHSTETLAAQTGGPRFGALVLDDCYNKLTASALMADLFSGKTMLHDPLSGEVIDMKKVVAVIGSQSSSVTLSALSLLTPLRIPTISYSATSPDLDDRQSYPYFLRPVPSDSLQARALVELVKLLNVTYVAAMHQNNNYGWRGIQAFVAMAEAAGICVESSVPVDDGDSEVDLHDALRDISNKDATVVVVFLVQPTVIKLLDAIDNQNLDLVFLASEAWTVSTDTLQNHRGMTARGSIVLTVDTSREAGDIKMDDYLKDLRTPTLAAHELPWMRDFWENEKQCNLPGGFTNSYSAMCDSDMKLSEEMVQELATDQKVVQTINAVASVTTALSRHCVGHSDSADCMLSLPAEGVTNLIGSVSLQDKNQRPFQPYLSNGNGNVGFTVHNVQKSSTGTYSYVKVGHYNPDQGLQLQKNLVFYSQVGQPISHPGLSSCKYKVQCRSVCSGSVTPATLSPPVNVTQSPVHREGGEEGGMVAAVVVLALLCVVLAVMLGMIVYSARRHGRIPWLGVVKRERVPVRRLTTRSSGVTRMSEGEVNLGFSPTSPRTSLPLPPVPRSSSEVTTHQYNSPTDMDSRVSLSSGGSSCHMGAATGVYHGTPVYDSSDDEGVQRVPSRHQSRALSQHQDLRRRIQDPGHQWDLQEHHRFPSSPSPHDARSGRERPRARSVPHPDRQFFQSQSLHHQFPLSIDTDVMDMQEGRHVSPRPRSHSHDAAFRSRLGALSVEDQQILLKYQKMAHEQIHGPHTTQGSVKPPHKQMYTPPSQQGSVRTPVTAWDGSRALEERPIFYLQHQQSNPPEAAAGDIMSPNIVFENPPPFCSSSRTSLNRRPEDNPSLLYLHAKPSESDMYLQLIAEPEPSDPSPPLNSSSPSLSTNTSSFSLPEKAPGSNSPARSARPPATGTPPTAAANPSAITATSPQSPQSAMSPLVLSVCGSEGSGAVFVSPDQDLPPFRYFVPKIISPMTGAMSPHTDPGSAPGQPHSTAVDPKQNRTAAYLSSPSQQNLLNPHPLQQGGDQNNLSPSSPASYHPTPQSSPQNASVCPGVFVRDRAGAVFWLPGVVVPPSQCAGDAYSGVEVSPTAVAPQGTGTGNPQLQRGDAVQSPQTGEHPLAGLPLALGQQTPVSLSPTHRQQAPVSLSPTHRQQAPVSLSPTHRQQTPVSFSHTQRQQTPMNLSPTQTQQTPVNLSPTQTQQTPVNLSPTHRQQTPVNLFPNVRQETPVNMSPTLRQQRPTTLAFTQESPVTLNPAHTRQSPVTLSPSSQARSRTPRMGVDCLKKQTEGVEQNHKDREPGRAAEPGSSLVSESTWNNLSHHSDSPQKNQPSEPVSDMPPPEGTVPHIEETLPVPTPSPCKPNNSPELSGSGGSNHTSGDSGTGEELNTDADNVTSRIEISV
ncbi:uncharacterized protein LOC143299956 [Babylonia areolata]|uniref:uncharacterized protein LOC143299956 n=1 Tax=Babylonia areolata TaxID=304850 RepID=UPI003FD1AA32